MRDCFFPSLHGFKSLEFYINVHIHHQGDFWWCTIWFSSILGKGGWQFQYICLYFFVQICWVSFFFFYSFFKNMLLSLIFAEDSKMTSAVKQTTSFTLHWMSLCSYSECTNTTFAIKNNVLYFYVAVFVV